jgi:hypothetical protein
MTLPEQSKPTSPVKAVRAFCLECCKESALEVKLCPAEECPLHAFRFGKNPYYNSRKLTDEEKQRNAERLRAFKLQKSQQTVEENFTESSGSINSHPDMSYEEKALSRGEYPVYPDLPEEHWD